MLDYETQMFLDILHEDGLLIAAKGLNFETVFMNLLKVYCDPGNLVIVLGATNNEEEYYITHLEAEGVKPLPKIITNEFNAADREGVYLGGGVMFVSPRILVVDLLKERLPIQHVTGFLVCRAHSVLESCQEAFAIRIYRQKNKTGFVKAFSSSPQAFTVGFAQVEHIMRTLFVRNLYLYPRFHAIVKASLEKCKPQVIELHLSLTPLMLEIQTAVLDLMNFTVKEVKRINQSLDTDEITVENAIAKSFHKILQLQLDPIWHQLSSKTKQLVADLKTLRLILAYLTQYDCVTFNSFVNSFRSSESAMRSSGWQLLDAAQTLFVASRKRVLGKATKDEDTVVQPEVNPKWEVLHEILGEIDTTSKEQAQKDPAFNNKVLILVKDSKTCSQVKQFLTVGAHEMLRQLYAKAFRCSARSVFPKGATVSVEEEEVDELSEIAEPKDCEEEKDIYFLSQRTVTEVSAEITSVLEEEKEDKDKSEDMEETEKSENGVSKLKDGSRKVDAGNESKERAIKSEPRYEECEQIESCDSVLSPPVIILQTIKKQGDVMSLFKTLNEMKPRFVILYDAEPYVIRRLEVYQSIHTEIQLSVYFVVYGGSVEEQAYLTALRREKEAFDFLIKEKATMVIPEDQDGKSGDCAQLSRDPSRPNLTVGPSSSRKGGMQDSTKTKPSSIIVDMREFRSELPSLIHKRGIEIDPVTLQVGDYILSPDICIERKSVNDLIGSLNSGRLYNQALSMTRHYSKPMLLIEFDQNKPFALQGCYFVSSDITTNDVSAKLQLLTLHFPKLKLVFSPSPYATAQLFEELKQGREEPDPVVAAEIGLEEEETEVLEKWNAGIHDLVARLPGVTTKNQRSLLLKGKSLDHLLTLSVDEITELIANSTEAKTIHDGLHKICKPEDDSGMGGKGSGRGTGRSLLPFKRRKL